MSANYFKHNPHLEVIYLTSDGLAFAKKTDAKAHASTLKNKEVERRTRKEVSAQNEEDTNSNADDTSADGNNQAEDSENKEISEQDKKTQPNQNK